MGEFAHPTCTGIQYYISTCANTCNVNRPRTTVVLLRHMCRKPKATGALCCRQIVRCLPVVAGLNGASCALKHCHCTALGGNTATSSGQKHRRGGPLPRPKCCKCMAAASLVPVGIKYQPRVWLQPPAAAVWVPVYRLCLLAVCHGTDRDIAALLCLRQTGAVIYRNVLELIT
jgi:hypothetical protein